MKNIAIAFSTKDQTELTRQTVVPLLQPDKFDLWWIDGSNTLEGQELPEQYNHGMHVVQGIRGGADAAIAYKLSAMLKHPQYEYIGIAENDVLLEDGWFEETMALFEKGKQDGLHVGAVSPRSYVDRVLIQRDGWAAMLNIGAGFIIFTREAAEIVLRSFRTGYWPTVRKLFAQISGIDIATYAAFRGNEQMVTTDWQFEAQLASHGLASLALTPAKCQMIGQNPPLAQQGLELVTDKFDPELRVQISAQQQAFERYRDNLATIRKGTYKSELPGIIHREGAGMLFYPHQLGYLAGGPTWQGTLELKWMQGFGPFAYRAGPGGASLSVRISGSCSFLCTGGDVGARIAIADTRSGFKFAPVMPANMEQFGSINVPGGPIPRVITMEMDEGAVFCGLSTMEPQLLDSMFRFDWAQLPEAK